VDFLRYTFPETTPLDEVLTLLGGFGWLDQEHGAGRYKRMFKRGNLVVLCEGLPGMGTHFQASGQGCRQMEEEGLVKDWAVFLGVLLDAGGKFKRFDGAVDDEKGLVTRQRVREALQYDTYVSRSTNNREVIGYKGNPGWTASFGTRNSDTMVNIYDKDAEEVSKGKLKGCDQVQPVNQAARDAYDQAAGLDQALTPRIRVELSVRDERAHELVKCILDEGWQVVAGLLRAHLDFKAPGQEGQKCRMEAAPWWDEFLAGADRFTLGLKKAVQPLVVKWVWMCKTLMPMLAVFRMARGWTDTTWLDVLLGFTAARLKPKYQALLEGDPAASEGSWSPHRAEWDAIMKVSGVTIT
jgi:hypothetical protein